MASFVNYKKQSYNTLRKQNGFMNGFMNNERKQNGFMNNERKQNGFMNNKRKQNGFMNNEQNGFVNNERKQNGFMNTQYKQNGMRKKYINKMNYYWKQRKATNNLLKPQLSTQGSFLNFETGSFCDEVKDLDFYVGRYSHIICTIFLICYYSGIVHFTGQKWQSVSVISSDCI